MKKLLITLAAVPCFAHADPFATYEAENNAGAPSISAFSPEMNRFYHDSLYNIDTPVYEFGEMFSEAKPDRKAPLEPVHFSNIRWSTEKPSIGLAQYTLPNLSSTISSICAKYFNYFPFFSSATQFKYFNFY